MNASGLGDRRLDGDFLDPGIASGFVGEESHQLIDELTENGGRSVLVT